MRITCTHSSNSLKIKGGSRVSIYTNRGVRVGQIEVPKRDGIQYCKDYPGGVYAMQLETFKTMAQELEDADEGAGNGN